MARSSFELTPEERQVLGQSLRRYVDQAEDDEEARMAYFRAIKNFEHLGSKTNTFDTRVIKLLTSKIFGTRV